MCRCGRQSKSWDACAASAASESHFNARFTENGNLRIRPELFQEAGLSSFPPSQKYSKNVCFWISLGSYPIPSGNRKLWLSLLSQNLNRRACTISWKKQASSDALLFQAELCSKLAFLSNCCVSPSATCLGACSRTWDIFQLSQQHSTYWDLF